MKVGIAFTLKTPSPSSAVIPSDSEESRRDPTARPLAFARGDSHDPQPPCDSVPDDLEEELDAPETIEALAATIAGLGHAVTLLGDGEALLRRLLAGPRPDLVWNLAEGRGSFRCREAWVPSVLQMLGIPYTGSDALTLAVTLDKGCAKRVVRDAGIATPPWVLVEDGPDAHERELQQLAFPVLLKPAYEGSSKGIRSVSLIHDPQELPDTIRRLAHAYEQPVLVEEFIAGDELTVGLIGGRWPDVLGTMRVVPNEGDPDTFIYDVETKRDYLQRVRFECPARLSPHDDAAVREAATASWRALGCRDVARLDFRLRDHTPYLIDANPLPGLSPVHSDLVILARLVGVDYPELISRILDAALERINGDERRATGIRD